ncbi:MAG TPA: hypothetical protein PK393_11425 [Synergistaceae bacterium]|nr:hypothetical protein [Synergistaceae bacterium]HQK26119.1 hypothetical protein [Synergistaceae bacterium]
MTKKGVWNGILLIMVLWGTMMTPLPGEGVVSPSEVEVLLVDLILVPPEIVGMRDMKHERFSWDRNLTVFLDHEGQKMDAEAFLRRYDRQVVVLVRSPSGEITEAYPKGIKAGGGQESP